ncbi:MAG TPA: outer membrane beta-barrel protein [Oleiagrimonas sp.]|nr:outer membrane beta-barrel protein [Oleiagrimonas sp.]
MALGLACAGMACSAQAKDLTGWFVNGGVGTAHYHATVGSTDAGSESDTSAQINFGWRSRFIGVEAGYVDLGSVETDIPGSAFSLVGYPQLTGGHAELSGDGWTLGLNGHFNPTQMWYISARGGLFMWKLHLDASATDMSGTTHHGSEGRQSADWYAGIGTGVDFNRHMSLGVNFDFYKIAKDDVEIDNKVYTVNFEYRF